MGLVQRRYEGMCSRALAALERHAEDARQAQKLDAVKRLAAVLGVTTVVWLKIVYTRCEVTSGLPIEYDTLQAFSYLAGIFFYAEYKSMDEAWMFVCGFSGLLVIIVGVTISSMSGSSMPGAPEVLRESSTSSEKQRSGQLRRSAAAGRASGANGQPGLTGTELLQEAAAGLYDGCKMAVEEAMKM